jgi:hypothetical protein
MTVALVLSLAPATAVAQHSHGNQGKHVHLHVNSRWSECSFQLDPALTQKAWRQFTREAGLVSYFRPLVDAKPMGRGNFEISLLQWATDIDDTDDAWNDTFVHPDSTHYLFEGSSLKFPGLTVRAGLTDRIDAGVYVTRSPGANYGFYGGQVQYNVVNDTTNGWAASARASFVSLYGPEDFDFTVYGVEGVTSRSFAVARWVSVSPYVGVSTYLSRSHEKSAVVDLNDENTVGVQAMVGVVARVASAKLAFEYNAAQVQSRSIKVGVSF